MKVVFSSVFLRVLAILTDDVPRQPASDDKRTHAAAATHLNVVNLKLCS
jgi:hypothetical protein